MPDGCSGAVELIRRQVVSGPNAEFAGVLADATKHQEAAACEPFHFLPKRHLPGVTPMQGIAV